MVAYMRWFIKRAFPFAWASTVFEKNEYFSKATNPAGAWVVADGAVAGGELRWADGDRLRCPAEPSSGPWREETRLKDIIHWSQQVNARVHTARSSGWQVQLLDPSCWLYVSPNIGFARSYGPTRELYYSYSSGWIAIVNKFIFRTQVNESYEY